MDFIKTNLMFHTASSSLKVTNRAQNKEAETTTIDQVDNSPSDKTLGYITSNQITAEIISFASSASLVANGISMMQTVESTLRQISTLTQRMTRVESNPSFQIIPNKGFDAPNQEYQELEQQIVNIISQTKWNMKNVLKDGASRLQVGTDSTHSVGSAGASAKKTYLHEVLTTLASLTLPSQNKVAKSSTTIDTAQERLNSKRAWIRDYINRLEKAIDNSFPMTKNLTRSSNHIENDYAITLSNMTSLQIIRNAGSAVSAQANAKEHNVLELLQ